MFWKAFGAFKKSINQKYFWHEYIRSLKERKRLKIIVVCRRDWKELLALICLGDVWMRWICWMKQNDFKWAQPAKNITRLLTDCLDRRKMHNNGRLCLSFQRRDKDRISDELSGNVVGVLTNWSPLLLGLLPLKFVYKICLRFFPHLFFFKTVKVLRPHGMTELLTRESRKAWADCRYYFWLIDWLAPVGTCHPNRFGAAQCIGMFLLSLRSSTAGRPISLNDARRSRGKVTFLWSFFAHFCGLVVSFANHNANRKLLRLSPLNWREELENRSPVNVLQRVLF